AVLLAMAVAACLSSTPPADRVFASAALAAGVIVPGVVAVARVRRLLAAGHDRDELVAILEARQVRRREELNFVYGPRPVGMERAMTWLARVALLGAATAAAGIVGVVAVPLEVALLLPAVAVGSAATALLASIVARARTERSEERRVGKSAERGWSAYEMATDWSSDVCSSDLPRPVGMERAMTWLARVALLGAATAAAGIVGVVAVPLEVALLLPAVAVGSAATALLASIVARARTEQRTDPRGERRLRFWRGAAGRWLFRIA